MILKNGYLHDLRTWFNFSTWRFVLCTLLLNYISWLLIFEKLFTVPLENKLKSGAYNDTVNITHYVIQSNSSVLLGNCNCLHVHTSIWSLCKLQDEYIQKINYDILHTDLTLLSPPPFYYCKQRYFGVSNQASVKPLGIQHIR